MKQIAKSILKFIFICIMLCIAAYCNYEYHKTIIKIVIREEKQQTK